MGTARRLRRAAVEAICPQRLEAVGAVLDFRPAGAGSARHVARGRVSGTAAPAKSKLIKGATGDWEVVIGMEVHAQVTSKAKLFSGASTASAANRTRMCRWSMRPCPACCRLSTRNACAQAVRTGLGLKAKINLKSVFDRKNYFYPDLPQGYQISQYKSPIVGEGEVVVDMADGDDGARRHRAAPSRAGRRQIAADQHATMSLVDLNRSGVALMEIVSKPELRSADEAKAFLGKLAPSSGISAPATATWRRAICAPT